jgi:hypothetical protein
MARHHVHFQNKEQEAVAKEFEPWVAAVERLLEVTMVRKLVI